jgi:Cellulase (glycosyl hydrolase family 5)
MISKKMATSRFMLFLVSLVLFIYLNPLISYSKPERNPLQEKVVMFPAQTSIGVNIHTPLYGKEIRSLGAKWARWGVNWENTEKVKSVYDFSKNDLIIDDFRKNDLKVLLGIDLYAYNSAYPAYDLENDKHLRELIKFTIALARRYKDKISVWEIGNEPNIDPKQIYNQPEKYTAAARAIARAIREVDPKAHIAALSTAWMDRIFISQCLKLGLLKDGTIDILSFHGYHRQNIMPESGLAEDVRWLREMSVKYRPSNKEVIVIDSERGYAIQPFMSPKHWGSYRNIVYSEAEQAAYLARHYLEEMYIGIEVSIWYKDMWGEQKFSLFEGGSGSRIRPMGRVMQNLSKFLPFNPKEMVNSEFEVSTYSPIKLSSKNNLIQTRTFVVKSKEKNQAAKLIVALWNPIEAFNGKILQSRYVKGENYEEIWRDIKPKEQVKVPIRVLVKNLPPKRIKDTVIVNLLSENSTKASVPLKLLRDEKSLTTTTINVGPTPAIIIFDINPN